LASEKRPFARRVRYLAYEEAICTRLRRWAVTFHAFDRGCRALLDQLRLEGEFEEWSELALESKTIYDAFAPEASASDRAGPEPALLAKLHAEAGGAEIIGDANEWAEYAGFEDSAALAHALRRAMVVRDVRRRVSRIAKLIAGAA
jgi:hypothetical protein